MMTDQTPENSDLSHLRPCQNSVSNPTLLDPFLGRRGYRAAPPPLARVERQKARV
jgi:hypothetical protein